MRREIVEKIEIPAGIELQLSENQISLSKGQEKFSRRYDEFLIKKEGNILELYCKSATKNQKKLIKTMAAHIRNAISGFDKKFVYRLQICSVHFPMTVTFDKSKKEVMVKNFLGEVKPRLAKVLDSVDVKIEKDIIFVEGHCREKSGQTAANIEKSTKITNRDRRTFQDGIYIIEKPGEKEK